MRVCQNPCAITSYSSVLTTETAQGKFKKSMGDEFWRERQLKEYRRTNGLCFKRGDKYMKEHTCKKAMQLLTIQMGDFGEVLPGDTLRALELTKPPTTEECFKLSVQAINGTQEGETI